MEYIARIHLKTGIDVVREDLIRFCLRGDEQYLAIGWSYVYGENSKITSFENYYDAVKKACKRIPAVHNIFRGTKAGDLFWTRDLDGSYWICRAIGPAKMEYVRVLDIGAVIPIKAYKYGLEVPGQIKASFNRARGGTSERIYDASVIEFSKKVYNQLSGTDIYAVRQLSGNILDNLPDFELEELVIAYIQLKENYYLLSNSIANKSTTIKIECEFIHRCKDSRKKAVVQVKGGRTTHVDARDYLEYENDGYVVYLFAPVVENQEMLKHGIVITKEELFAFYEEYKEILPDSITKWETL